MDFLTEVCKSFCIQKLYIQIAGFFYLNRYYLLLIKLRFAINPL
jgi:hypothetical protein